MKRSAQEIPARVSRSSMSTTKSTADNGSRKANNNDSDVCDDNDLGTEWTGNLDCDDGAKNKGRQR
jgi:hypothetical protein